MFNHDQLAKKPEGVSGFLCLKNSQELKLLLNITIIFLFQQRLDEKRIE